jgi:hypothetical protein
VVQFARNASGNQMLQYALKVFLQHEDFDEVCTDVSEFSVE